MAGAGWRLRGVVLLGAAVTLGGCAAGAGFPSAIADAEPIPGGCPPSICPQHTPTQPPPPTDEPEPGPTATPTKSAKPSAKPQASGTANPTAGVPSPGATATPGKPAPPAPAKIRFAAFPFSEVPYGQPFPSEAPPPPSPLPAPPSGGMVALAAVLAAGVAAATSITARRRAWATRGPGPPATGGRTL